MEIMEYIQNLPPLMQFILALLAILGTSGFFTGGFAVWKLYAQANTNRQAAVSKAKLETELTELKLRLEPLELERLRTENEAKQIESMNSNMKNLIDVIAARDDRWQNVFDKKSERQLEAEKLQQETNRMFIDSVKENTKTVTYIGELLEVQSEHLGGFGRIMQHFEGKMDKTIKIVEDTTRDNRNDLTTALGMNVTNRTENENALRSIMQAIETLRHDVKYILTQNETQRTQTLAGVDAKFKLIEQRLTEFIMPLSKRTEAPDTNRDTESDNEESAA